MSQDGFFRKASIPVVWLIPALLLLIMSVVLAISYYINYTELTELETSTAPINLFERQSIFFTFAFAAYLILISLYFHKVFKRLIKNLYTNEEESHVVHETLHNLETELSQNRDFLKLHALLFDALEESIIVLDEHNNVIETNSHALSLLGIEKTRAIGQAIHTVFPPTSHHDETILLKQINQAKESNLITELPHFFTIESSNQKKLYLHAYILPFEIENVLSARCALVFKKIPTSQSRLLRPIAVEAIKHINTPCIIAIQENEKLTIIYANDALLSLTDKNQKSITQLDLLNTNFIGISQQHKHEIKQALFHASRFRTFVVLNQGQHQAQYDMTLTPLPKTKNLNNRPYVISFIPVTQNRPSKQTVHPTQTGQIFTSPIHLQGCFQKAQASGHIVSVLYLAIERPHVDANLQETVGGTFLELVVEKIKIAIRSDDSVIYLGEDQFIVILQGIHEVNAAKEGASRVSTALIKHLSSEINLLGVSYRLNAQIGIAVSPEDGNTIVQLVKNANLAVRSIQKDANLQYGFFNAEHKQVLMKELEYAKELTHALGLNQLDLVYHPQFSTHTKRIIAVEALLRWHHPTSGTLYPSVFLHFAQNTQLMLDIDAWVIKTAHEQLTAWRSQHYELDKIITNVSSDCFWHENYVQWLKKLVDEYTINPADVELDIKENTLMKMPEEAIAILKRVKEIGFIVSMSSFGLGESSILFLEQFPIDIIKIPPTILSQQGSTANDTSILSSIVSFAHSLNVQVVLEGVETNTQLDLVQKSGCDALQGHVFTQPLDAKMCEKHLQASNPK